LPALVLGKKWHKKNPEGRVIFFSSSKKLDKKIVEQNEFLHKVIFLNLSNFPGKRVWLYPKFFIQLFLTFFKSFFYLAKYLPEKIISTGGYIAIPVCVAGKFFKIFVELHELNYVPGKAIKALSFLANKIFITFEQSKKLFGMFSNRCFFENYPVRFSEQDKVFDKNGVIERINSCSYSSTLLRTNREKNSVVPFALSEACEQSEQVGCQRFSIKFSEKKKTIFLLGGSQGSLFLNNLFKDWLLKNQNLADKIQVIHQTGMQDKTDWPSFYQLLKIPAITFSYTQNIKDYYQISDVIICRAGAGTLFELKFFEKKSLVIPIKTAYTDHQIDNALQMAKKHPELFLIQDQETINKNFSVFEKNLEKNLL